MNMILLYVDPGSGSYLVQAIIAAVLGAIFYFKGIWFRVKAFFSKKTGAIDKGSLNNDKPNAGD